MACSEQDTHSGKLYIRFQEGDGGQRPIDPCTNYWGSPDLWLDPGNGSHQTTATEGTAVNIKARVTNMAGQGATTLEDVSVEAWVCNYTLGEVGPATAITPRFVGTAFGPLSPGASVVVDLDKWTPTHDQATTNMGHVCLGANCWAGDPGAPTDGRPLPATGGHLNYCCDSHTGQLNLQLTPLVHDEQQDPIPFMMFGGEEGLEAEIHIAPPRRVLLGKFEQQFILQNHVLAEALRPLEKRLKPHPSKFKPGRFEIAGPGMKPGHHGKIRLGPKEEARFDVRVQGHPKDDPGAVHAFDMVATDPNGETIGGARLLTVAL